MSTYTTGEIAKLCGVTVRTVQYYDSRGILVPSELSEGGRRIYTENDVLKLRSIHFLRDLGLSIKDIASFLEDDHADEIIQILLEQQLSQLEKEIKARKENLQRINQLKEQLKTLHDFSINYIGDVAFAMNKRKKLKKVYAIIFIFGILLDLLEVGFLTLGFMKGIWIPFIIFLPALIFSIWTLVHFYYKNVVYICPECHKTFQPSMKEFFWASHTPKTRKVTCTHCGHKGFCIETYKEAEI